MEYRIVTWHGESHTVHYLVEFDPINFRNWHVLATYSLLDAAKEALERAKRGEVQ